MSRRDAPQPRIFSPSRAKPLQRATSWLAGGVDRLVTRGMRRLFLSDGIPTQSAEELERRLALLDVFKEQPERLLRPQRPLPDDAITTVSRKRISGGARSHHRFHTPYQPVTDAYAREFQRYDRVSTAHFYAWRHSRPAPASLLLLHGWGVGRRRVHELEFGVRRLFRDLGLDVYFYVSPFHGLRTPAGASFSGALHPSPHLLRTNETFVQTCQELHTLITHILRHNDAPLGVMGSSLGGYTAALLASIDPRLSFSIPIMPPASLADLFWAGGEGDATREAVEAMGMTLERFRDAWSIHSPLSYQPRVSWERRLLLSIRGDNIVPPEQVERLWEHWGRPAHIQLPGGHLLHPRGAYHRVVQRFLRERGILS